MTPYQNDKILGDDLEHTVIRTEPDESTAAKILSQDEIAYFLSEITHSELSRFPDLLTNKSLTPAPIPPQSPRKLNPLQLDNLSYSPSLASASSKKTSYSSFAPTPNASYAYNSISPVPMVPAESLMTNSSQYLDDPKELDIESLLQMIEQDEPVVSTSTVKSTIPEIEEETLEDFPQVNLDDDSILTRTVSIGSANLDFGNYSDLDQLLQIKSDPTSALMSRVTSYDYTGTSYGSFSTSPMPKVARRVSCPTALRPSIITHEYSSPTPPVYMSNDRILSMTLPKKTTPRITKRHSEVFICPVCGNTLSRAANLKQHCLSVHGEERPYPCRYPDCDWRFSRPNDRTRHENQHSGVKKFICHGVLPNGKIFGCGKGFKRSDGLGRHFRTETGKKCIQPLVEFQESNRRNRFDRPDDSDIF
ncbi:uncharacterized protein SPAPADRAFT_62287 [Spathaspora passalidarum NRRL Y-27907]|uniref:C2H2-type domain-containing protein n=1 Tax=Spathaspora passalidarum (strain NRRL Y-27907 / 11-Y1) TaxID=619300 RepID=G3AR15_SPAPN|nr:uncharacterized protein SPAPADRAFT_62287 [Spathaspora passalidarum NRRL Y-27907]EGW31676.1 hypothetical protein SPAPADRAFT_62287 [Spathaspora passalidarum NRRL Y-27907]